MSKQGYVGGINPTNTTISRTFRCQGCGIICYLTGGTLKQYDKEPGNVICLGCFRPSEHDEVNVVPEVFDEVVQSHMFERRN